jgi:hypothetical protein
LAHADLIAVAFAADRAGRSIAAKIPIIAITTRSSTRVKEMRNAECGMRISARQEEKILMTGDRRLTSSD